MKAKFMLSPVVVFLFLFSNVISAQVSANFDSSTDFSQFKTYTFKGWEKNSDSQLNQLDKERVEKAFKQELSSRGMSEDTSNPDVGITLFITIKDKTSTTAYTNFNGGFGYGRGFGYGYGMGGMGMGSASTTVSENDYQEGTIVIDFYDEKSKDLLFQGTLQSVVKKGDKREKTIPKEIAKLMKKYPVKPMK
jgi:hypothetical protein